MIRLTIIILAFWIISCGHRDNKQIATKTVNDRLIDFKMQTIMTMDSLFTLSDSTYEMLKSNSFNGGTDTIRYNENEIYVSYLTVVNGCAEYKGDFEIKNDTIDLSLVNNNDQTCTEEE